MQSRLRNIKARARALEENGYEILPRELRFSCEHGFICVLLAEHFSRCAGCPAGPGETGSQGLRTKCGFAFCRCGSRRNGAALERASSRDCRGREKGSDFAHDG